MSLLPLSFFFGKFDYIFVIVAGGHATG